MLSEMGEREKERIKNAPLDLTIELRILGLESLELMPQTRVGRLGRLARLAVRHMVRDDGAEERGAEHQGYSLIKTQKKI